jgi:hypothetical protein
MTLSIVAVERQHLIRVSLAAITSPSQVTLRTCAVANGVPSFARRPTSYSRVNERYRDFAPNSLGVCHSASWKYATLWHLRSCIPYHALL